MITLLKDRILVKPFTQTFTDGGILLFQNEEERPLCGELIMKGPGLYNKNFTGREPIDVEVGQTIWFGKYAGIKVRLKDENYLIMCERDILAVGEGLI